MQRPRNNQSHNRDASSRGRGRGPRQSQNQPRGGEAQNVPSISQVVPNAPVSIVLKADQGTGREVQGFVQDLLTKGNHPRGIKVRLADGRVGRVQRMVNESEAKRASEGLSGLGEDGVMARGSRGIRNGGGWEGRRYDDVRQDEEATAPAVGYSLEHFLPAGHPLRQDGQAVAAPEESVEVQNGAKLDMLVCPVCGEFEGDEAAVSHHVNGHFDGT